MLVTELAGFLEEPDLLCWLQLQESLPGVAISISSCG
jgi:hypothetical protein